jgi:hypothetical protein
MRANWTKLVIPALIILTLCIGIGIWLILPSVLNIASPAIAIDTFETAILTSEERNGDQFAIWYKSNIIIQCTLILTALMATVFASVTTKDNAERVKKWSVLLTAITAALASIHSTFHVRENIETLIRTSVDLTLLEADYLAARAPFANELKSKDAADNAETQKKLTELHVKFMGRYAIILSNRMHAWANIGQQSSPPQEAPQAKADGK